ncbi:HAMP domain-containing histidine kinase [Tepidibacillus marianensis]|uniref:sensor histidine kinase n=1 Tax=Tepidibacillus marianensis TaxID=3131995 RepID=UPI0030CD1686
MKKIIKKIINKFYGLPIKIKLILWSSLLLFLLFLSYNVLQYFVLDQWVFNQEEKMIQQKLKEVQAYFHEESKSENVTEATIRNSTGFLNKTNEKYEMIRILDNQGSIIMVVTNEMPDQPILPQVVNSYKLEYEQTNQDRILIERSPINVGQFHGTIEIAKSMETFDSLLDQVLMVMIGTGLGAILLSILGGVIISNRLLKPIQSITGTMKRIKKNGLHERVPVKNTRDEITEIGIVFNNMMEQLESVFLQQKQFIEDVSHELRTPITIIEGHLSLLNRWGKYDPLILDESLAASTQELSRLKKMVLELLEIIKFENTLDGLDVAVIDPIPIIQKVIRDFSILNTNVVFETNFATSAKVNLKIAHDRFEQILIIFIDNAIKYSPNKKWIKIRTKLIKEKIWIEIIDHGIGIPENDLPFIFHRFYRVDKARTRKEGGNGLGLAIAKQYIEKYQGEVQVKSLVGEGTTIILKFPVIEIN